jgi:hypothetical protein
MAKTRTVMRSKAGKKLYAVRDEKGAFTDIQSYERAHSQDLRKKSKVEVGKAAKKKATPKKVKKATKRGK